MEQELVRRFEDAIGTQWEVREIHVPSLSIVPRKYLRQPEYADGWLLFTSDGERRRLAPCPCDWRDIAPVQLAFLCSQAVRVTERASQRPAERPPELPSVLLADHASHEQPRGEAMAP